MEAKMNKKSSPVANLSNQLAFNISWNLTFREWNIVLYLVSQIDSKNQDCFDEQIVSVKEIEAILKSDDKKWGGLYAEISKIRKSLLSKPIDFYTDVIINGKPLMGGVNFFEMISPMKDERGAVYLKFKFTRSVKPLLLQLQSHFVSISQNKTKYLKNGHAIRFLIAAKAKRDMMRSYETVSTLKYSLDGFKMLLGIPNKYADFRNFKRAVISKIQQEINTKSDYVEIIDIKYYPEKSKPKTEVEFFIKDRNNTEKKQFTFSLKEDWKPSNKDIDILSRSKKRAYEMLTKYGVSPGIAYREIIGKIKGSEIIGFEDWYIKKILSVFDVKTKKKAGDKKGRAGSFVNWFCKTSFQDDQFSEGMEHILQKKKKLQNEDPIAWDNRQIAKNMTDKEFEIYYRNKEKADKKDISIDGANERKNQFTSTRDVLADMMKNRKI